MAQLPLGGLLTRFAILQRSTESNHQRTDQETDRVLLDESGRTLGGRAGRGGRGARGGTAGGGRRSRGSQGRGGRRRGRGRSFTGIEMAALLESLLALILGGQIAHILLDALFVVLLADKEWNGLHIRRDVGRGTIAADAAELKVLLDRHQCSPFSVSPWSRRGPQRTALHEFELATPPQIFGQLLRSAVHHSAVDRSAAAR